MNYILFTTTRCPKCPAFKKMVAESVSIPGEILDEQHSKFSELTQKFSITHVPMLFVFSDETQTEILLQTGEATEVLEFFSHEN